MQEKPAKTHDISNKKTVNTMISIIQENVRST